MKLSLTTERIWSWLASICVILTLVLFSYTIYCVVDNVRLKNRQKGIVQSIQDDIKIDDNTKMVTKCGAGALFFGLLSGFFYYETQRKKKERAGIKEELKRDSRVVLQSTEGSLVSEETHEAQKEELSLSNETTVNQAVAIHIHTESTSQVAVANVAVEQSPEAETVKDQRSEGLKELEKASVETNDIGRPKEEAAETFEERTKASKSDDNVPKESRDQDQEANSQDVSMKYMEYLAIRRVLDKDFCGDDDVVFHHLCDDTVTIITTYSPPEKRFKRVCEVATSLYYDENKDHKTAVDVSKAPVFADWLILFLKSFGYSEEQLPKKQNIRKSNYSPRKLIESTPMYYLDADSWDDFKDAEKLRHYLKQK